VGSSEAASKYWAVHHLGPRWDAHYRWTGFLGLNKRLRKPNKSGGPMASPPPPSPEEIEASRLRDERILKLEMDEYNKAKQLIEDLQLGPESVTELKPNPMRTDE
jgi:hypothetical protein